jgi:hypothetical protein
MQILLLWNNTDKKYIELRYNTGFYKVYKYGDGILEQSMGARNRVETELSYRPASLCSLAGSY